MFNLVSFGQNSVAKRK